MIVDLYRFSIGLERHLYTTAAQRVTYNEEDYEPIFVRRDGGHGTESTARSSLEIHLPRDAGIITRFAAGAPAETVEVEIYQQNESTTALVYLGRVLGIASRGSLGVLTCESIHTALQTAGLRRRHQILCPYALYDTECGVDPQPFRTEAALTAATPQTLSSPAFDGQDDGWFTGGYIEWGDLPERRAIVGHAGDTITLDTPLPGPEAEDTVIAFAGCDHSFATCIEKFDNGDNHGGMPWLPRQNPFGENPIY